MCGICFEERQSGALIEGKRIDREPRMGLMANCSIALLVAASMALSALSPVAAQEVVADPDRVPDPIEGIWRTLELSEVSIAPCPQGFCGTISKIVVPSEGLTPEEYEIALAMPVESFTDVRNPDPTLRDRPMLGLQILTLVPSDKPNIYDGEIYNPEDGNTYSGYVQMTGADLLKLNGCVLYNIVCQGQDWARVIPEPVAAQ